MLNFRGIMLRGLFLLGGLALCCAKSPQDDSGATPQESSSDLSDSRIADRSRMLEGQMELEEEEEELQVAESNYSPVCKGSFKTQ